MKTTFHRASIKNRKQPGKQKASLPSLISTATGGLPVKSGTLADVDLDRKSLDFRWEI
jgi:hypothetical protein